MNSFQKSNIYRTNITTHILHHVEPRPTDRASESELEFELEFESESEFCTTPHFFGRFRVRVVR